MKAEAKVVFLESGKVKLPADDVGYFNWAMEFLMEECKKIVVKEDGMAESICNYIEMEVLRIEAKQSYLSDIMNGKKREIAMLCVAIDLLNTLKIFAKDNNFYGNDCKKQLEEANLQICKLIGDFY